MRLYRMRTIPGVLPARSALWTTLLTLVTCGLYGVYWVYSTTESLSSALDDEELSPKVSAVATAGTLGLYGIHVAYQLDQRIQRELGKLDARHRPLFLDYVALVLVHILLPGLGFLIAQHLLQRDLNALRRAARAAHGHDQLDAEHAR